MTFSRIFYTLLLLPVAALLLLFSACQHDREALVQRQVQQKVAEFKKKYTAECEDKFLAEAGHLADSVLLAEAKAALADSLARNKPVKPIRPPAIPPIDSSIVKPIF